MIRLTVTVLVLLVVIAPAAIAEECDVGHGCTSGPCPDGCYASYGLDTGICYKGCVKEGTDKAKTGTVDMSVKGMPKEEVEKLTK
jgi:hypothetical protein